MKSFSIYLTVFLSTISHANNNQPLNTEYKLLFFCNIDNKDCKKQNEILNTLAKDANKYYTLNYYDTSKKEDIIHFYNYKIKPIPQLIITNKEGKELFKFKSSIIEANEIINQFNILKSTKK